MSTNTFLKYGDIVAFYCLDSQASTAAPNLSRHGFLCGLGFTDDGVYVQLESGEFSNGIESVETPRHFRRYLFQLTPRLGFEAHDDYQKNLGYYKELIRNSGFARREFEKYRSMKK